MDWHRLAVKLGKTVREVQTGQRCVMSAWEWMLWRAYMQLEPNLFNPIHYYFAALTAEVAKGHSKKNAKGLSLKDRLIKFVLKKIRRKVVDDYEVDKRETMRDYDDRNDSWPRDKDGNRLPKSVVAKMRVSKGAWFRAGGLNKEGKPTSAAKKKAAKPLPKGIKRGKG
jgi:hypothetical protein